MKFETILVEELEKGILKIALNRPKTLNALNLLVLQELAAAFEKYGKDPKVRVIIFTGEGEKAFIAGADIEAMSNMGTLEAREYVTTMSYVTKLMDQCQMPLIAAVKGFTFGGGNIMAMHCDLVFATDDSAFGQQEINLGIMGGVPRLIYLVGLRKALDLVLTGRIIKAGEAQEIGLINKCLPREEFDSFILEYARKLAQKPAVAVKLIKASKNVAEKACLELPLHYETELECISFAAEDAREGLKAFVEKRKPNFTGK